MTLSYDLPQVTNAVNLRCHYVASDRSVGHILTFFVDLHEKADASSIAKCSGGQVGDLPLTVRELRVFNFGGAIRPDAAIEKLKNFAGSHSLGDNADWSIHESILQLNIVMSDFPAKAAAAAAGVLVQLVSIRARNICKVYQISINIITEGQAPWMALTVSEPRPPDDEEGVSRQLMLDFSSPQDDLDRHDDVDRELVVIGNALTVDVANPADTTIVFYPNSFGGNFFSTDLTLFYDIGVRIKVIIDEDLDEADRARAAQRRKKATAPEMRNVIVAEGTDAARNEPTVEIHFDASRDFGTIDMDKLLNFSIGSGRTVSHLVADCNRVAIGHFLVDFIAIRAKQPMPSEKEVYHVVSTFFEGSEDHELRNLPMDDVRAFVFERFPFMLSRSLDEQQELKQRVWACTRAYLIFRMTGVEFIYMDDLDDLSSVVTPRVLV